MGPDGRGGVGLGDGEGVWFATSAGGAFAGPVAGCLHAASRSKDTNMKQGMMKLRRNGINLLFWMMGRSSG
jgi:hypothetical protein